MKNEKKIYPRVVWADEEGGNRIVARKWNDEVFFVFEIVACKDAMGENCWESPGSGKTHFLGMFTDRLNTDNRRTFCLGLRKIIDLAMEEL